VPTGMDGTVIDVQVFTRDGVEKDERALSIEREALAKIRKDLNDQCRIFEDDAYARLERLLVGQVAAGGPKLKAGSTVTQEYLNELPRDRWFEIRMREDDINAQLERVQAQLKAQREAFDRKYEE